MAAITYLSIVRKLGRTMRPLMRVSLIVFLAAAMLLTAAAPAQAAVPTFAIKTVVKDVSVTILAHDFPAAKEFTVRMGEYGTLGIGGIVVGTFNSGAGGSFEATFNIPAALAGRAAIAIRMDSTTGGYYSYNWFYNDPSAGTTPGYTGIPTFTIKEVVVDTSVKVLTSNFPASQDFTVRMGEYGTEAIGGTIVGTFNSGAGGAFEATFNIPDALKTKERIAIRMDSSSGVYFAYNWFYNVNPAVPGYTGIPTFSIKAVVADDNVTVLTNNFPAGLTFTVRMGAYGTKAVGGTVVGTVDSGAGGAFEATFPIPDALKGSYQIAIRMDSPTGYYYAYNWFYNNTAPAPVVPPTPVEPIPTISILSVVKDASVTIQTWNYPAGQAFNVYMGPYGTLGVGGTFVQVQDSGAGGSFTATYPIPASLLGHTRIAIRLETADNHYFSYNWFWNN